MTHQYKVGDKVQIKKRKGSPYEYPYPFAESMNKLAGTICEIKGIHYVKSFSDSNSKYIDEDYHMYEIRPVDSSDCRDFVWAWHSSMFEPVIEKENMSYNYGDSIKVLEYSGKICEATYFFVSFDTPKTTHEVTCSKIREVCSDFCEIAKNMGAIKNIDNEKLFPEFPTIEKLVAFVNKINELYSQKPSSEFKQILTTSKTLNENEIKFQRAKASSKRGIVPTGRAICGRRCKTAIKLGHLSHTTCYC